MARKNSTAVATAPVAAPAEINKAQAVRDYHAANPTATPADISKALAANGIEVSSGRVSNLLRKASAGPKLNVDQLKAAAAFVKEADSEMDDIIDAVKSVGKFVSDMGSVEAALAALETYKAVAASMGK